jgi:hypothetical protein
MTTRQTVLDLGSGGGIDVLPSAKRVGPTGKADATDLARPTAARRELPVVQQSGCC